MIIKNIKYLNKSKNYLIETDKGELTILENTLAKFNLYKSKEISINEINDIIYENELYTAKNLALKYLSNMKTEKEVKDYLTAKNINTEIISDTLNYLKKEKYLDDKIYAELFTKDKIKLKQDGPNKIKSQLLSKGINSNIINEILNDMDYTEIYNNLLNLAEKKYITLQHKDKKEEKLIRYLISKGYDYSLIKEILKEINE